MRHRATEIGKKMAVILKTNLTQSGRGGFPISSQSFRIQTKLNDLTHILQLFSLDVSYSNKIE